eukprot:SAG11_NODE_2584_length_3195_cov_2.145026_3_plen_100_part_00
MVLCQAVPNPEAEVAAGAEVRAVYAGSHEADGWNWLRGVALSLLVLDWLLCAAALVLYWALFALLTHSSLLTARRLRRRLAVHRRWDGSCRAALARCGR